MQWETPTIDSFKLSEETEDQDPFGFIRIKNTEGYCIVNTDQGYIHIYLEQ